MAKISVIVGSVRSERQGIKVARWIEKSLAHRNHRVFFIDPLELNLPLLDQMYKEMSHPSEKLCFLRNQNSEADVYLPITPEYNRSTLVR
jgi:NAD(P)H-dependent FMN reductase